MGYRIETVQGDITRVNDMEAILLVQSFWRNAGRFGIFVKITRARLIL